MSQMRHSPDPPIGDRFAQWSEDILREEWLASVPREHRFNGWGTLDKIGAQVSNFRPERSRAKPKAA
jgi:hypothetical protein